jgi:hypothetical protein
MTGVRMLSVSVSAHRSVPAVKKRLGAVVLELIVVLPTLFACTLVAAQFGASLSGAVAVHQASVAGVQMASVLGRSNQAVLLAGIRSTVNDALVSAGISTDSAGPGVWCAANLQIIVQERLSDPPVYAGSSGADGVAFQVVPAAAGIPADCVRVTVNVRLNQVAPDLLSSFGFSVTGRYVSAGALRSYNGS